MKKSETAPESSCDTCRYFESYGKEGTTHIGECRRHAPRPMLISDTEREPVTFWPIVEAATLCGEYREEGPRGEYKHILALALKDTRLCVRSRNALQYDGGCETVLDIVRMSLHTILSLRGLGRYSLNDIRHVLTGLGLPGFDTIDSWNEQKIGHQNAY